MLKARRHLKALSDLHSLQGLKVILAERQYLDGVIALKDQHEVCVRSEEAVASAVSDWEAFWTDPEKDPSWLPMLSAEIQNRQNILVQDYEKKDALARDLETLSAQSRQEDYALSEIIKRRRRTKRRLSQASDDYRNSLYMALPERLS